MSEVKSKYKQQFDFIEPGTLFGYWKVVDNFLEYKNGKLSALCICTKCNITEKYVCCQKLLSGFSNKCKTCHLKEISSGEVHETYKGIISTVFSNIKKGAKQRNIEFDLTMEQIGDLFEKQQGKCKLSGLELKLKSHYLDNTSTASLDRKDSKQGYTIDNIQWVHKDINLMKNQFDENYFISLCKQIAKSHNT